MAFLFLNLLVHLTYRWSGRVSFSYLSLRLIFEDGLTNLTGQPGLVGVLLFCLFTMALLRTILAMIGTKIEILAWLLLLVILASSLPIFDFKRIFL